MSDEYFIVDGRHRLEAFNTIGSKANKRMSCVVIEEIDSREALARVFKDNAGAKMDYTSAERTVAVWKER